jgi:hypothetical protein
MNRVSRGLVAVSTPKEILEVSLPFIDLCSVCSHLFICRFDLLGLFLRLVWICGANGMALMEVALME